MTTLRVIACLFLTFWGSMSAFADDEAFNFFVEACRHSGFNPSEIATFQADIKIATKTAWSDSQVESVMSRMKKNMDEMLKDADWSDENRQQYEEFVEGFRRQLSDSVIDNTNRVSVRNSASLVGLADTHAYILVENKTDKQSVFFSQSAEKQISGIQFEDRRVQINEVVIEPPMYHLYGRIGTPMIRRYMEFLLSANGEGGFDITDAGIAAFKKDCEANQRTFTLSKERETYDGNYSAYILEVYENGRIQDRFWVDSDRGYICPKAQMFFFNAVNETTALHSEITSENFVLDEPSQKWFPMKIVSVAGKYQEAKTGKAEQSVEMNVVPGTLALNQPISDSVFAIAVQQGGRVDDFRRDDTDKSTFIANQNGALDLPTVENKSLDAIPWLEPREVAQPQEPYPIEKASFTWTRAVLMAVGIVMIILGLIIHFYKKTRTVV